jgi:hypothetical protein
MQSAAISEDDVLPYAEVFSLPLGLYLAWQLGYWFIIEVPSRLCTDISISIRSCYRYVVTPYSLYVKRVGTWYRYLLSSVLWILFAVVRG